MAQISLHKISGISDIFKFSKFTGNFLSVEKFFLLENLIT